MLRPFCCPKRDDPTRVVKLAFGLRIHHKCKLCSNSPDSTQQSLVPAHIHDRQSLAMLHWSLMRYTYCCRPPSRSFFVITKFQLFYIHNVGLFSVVVSLILLV